MTDKNQVVYENDMFSIELATPIMSKVATDDVLVYAVINKETGVRETETTVLLQAMSEADNFKVRLEQYGGEADIRRKMSQIESPLGGGMLQ